MNVKNISALVIALIIAILVSIPVIGIAVDNFNAGDNGRGVLVLVSGLYIIVAISVVIDILFNYGREY